MISMVPIHPGEALDEPAGPDSYPVIGLFEGAASDAIVPEAEEQCTAGEAEPLVQEFAELFKLRTEGFCNQAYVEAPTARDLEMCGFDEPSAFEFSEEAFRPAVLTSLDLASYQRNHLAIRSVERNLRILTVDIKDRFALWLGRSARYIRMMKNILREEGIPEDMAYLPLIESGFNTRAYSRRKAAGPWQFIPGTGRRYGLKIDYWVDERRDPVKSTRAAARYLRDLHEIFDSWSLAMAAYNAGENKIKRALARTRSNDFWDLIATRHIKPETKNYVPKFIAARLIAVEPHRYGFDDVIYHEDFTYDEVALEGPLSLDIVARCAETTPEIIKELNPELRRWITPPVESYVLRIPRGSRETFLANLPSVPESKRVTVKVHRVIRGETVSVIANKYAVPADSIISYNKLTRRGFINVGQMLLIPVSMRAN